jgi:hypothetical protein
MQRGVQGSGFHLEGFLGGALNVARDGVPVSGPGHERAQNQEVERALQEVEAGGAGACHVWTFYSIMSRTSTRYDRHVLQLTPGGVGARELFRTERFGVTPIRNLNALSMG